jgi:nitrate/TMAO reductase-like tetraheme cytochrome c subunit
LSKRRIVIIGVLLGIVVIGGVGAVGLWTYHEQPQFCATCHIMDPYLASWENSDYGAHAHAAEDVTCLECHEPTTEQQINELVVYLQGDFTVPLLEREFGNEFCFDCHLPNEHTSYDEVIQLTAGFELNPHSSHLVDQLDCNLCHKMHETSEDYCGYCHGPVATGAGWTIPVSLTAQIDVWEPDMDCTVCHVMDPYVESLDNADLLAYAHAQEGLQCLDCHTDLEELRQAHEEAVAGTGIRRLRFDVDFCFDCHIPNEHTSYAEVIALTQDYIINDENINPHDPHPGSEEVGQLECYYCHQMHRQSPLIEGCYSCHHERNFQKCSVCHGE